MAHAKPEDLKDLDWLLKQLRTLEQLKEKSLGCFYCKGKGVLHFHTQKGRRYAHVSDGKNWHEIDLPTPISATAQKNAFSQIQKRLKPCK